VANDVHIRFEVSAQDSNMLVRANGDHAGREMKDMHPLMVLSPRDFNERTGIVIGLPMTTAAYNDNNPSRDR
jgi:mRNA-degrading endonuclease toxin of MazEF toxin-antitoxin module